MKRFIKILIVLVLAIAINPINKSFSEELPKNIIENIKSVFPTANFRFDGLITLNDGTQYLPVFPMKYEDVKEPMKIVQTLPAKKTLANKPDLVLYANNFALLKIIREPGEPPTVISSNDTPITVKLGMLSQDMLVPSGLTIPSDLRIILGDLKIPIKEINRFKKLPAATKQTTATTKTPQTQPIVNVDKELKDLLNTKFYISNYNSNSIFIVDPFIGRPEKELKLNSIPSDMAVTSDNRYILVSGIASNTLSVVDKVGNVVLKELQTGSLPSSILISGFGNNAFIANKMSSTLSVLDLSNMVLKDPISVVGSPVKLTLSEDGLHLFYQDAQTNNIYRMNLTTPSPCELVTNAENLSKFINIKDKLYFLNRAKNELNIFDITNKKLLKTISVGSKPVDIKNINGKLYVLCAGNDTIYVINPDLCSIDKEIKLESGGFSTSINILPNTNKAIITNTDAYVFIVLDTTNNVVLKKFPISINVSSLLISKSYNNAK